MASSSKTNCRPSTESVVRFWVDPADSDDDKSSVDEDEDEISEEEEEEREWTEEETLLYRRALKESEGFDLPELPYNGKLGGITRIRAHSLSLPCHRKCAEVAINYYNSHNGTNFEFVEVEKACSQIVCGCMFYLTLKVRPAGMPAHYPTTCLQAKVLYGIDNIQTRLCRIKPDPSSAGKKSSPQCSSGTNWCCPSSPE